MPTGCLGQPGAASPEDYLEQLLAEAGAQGVGLQQFNGDGLGELADTWRRDRPDAMWVAGGDGTVLAVSAITRDLGIPLGILPAGTMNLLARDLGMDLDIAKAVRQLKDAVTARIDVAELNGGAFLCIANFGMPTRLTERREHLRRRSQWLRWPLLAWYLLKLLVGYPRMKVSVRIGGRQHVLRTRAASISNNPLAASGSVIPARERIDRGELGVYVTRETSFWSLPRLALRLLTREWQEDDELQRFSGERLRIDIPAKKTIRIMCDGEMRRVSMPLTCVIHPRAMSVLKPSAGS